MRWAEQVARMEEKRNRCRLKVGKPEGKRPLGRPRCTCVDNIKMDLGDVGWGDVDWVGLAQDRNRWRALVNWVLNLQVPQNAGKLLSDCTTCGAQLHTVSWFLVRHFKILWMFIWLENITRGGDS
jgi:hypothetical protein